MNEDKIEQNALGILKCLYFVGAGGAYYYRPRLISSQGLAPRVLFSEHV